jgi:transposase
MNVCIYFCQSARMSH